MQSKNQPGFFVNRHFIKDLSFENPNGPFLKEGEAEKITMETQGSVHVIPDKEKENDKVDLTLTLTARLEGKVIYLCEMTYSLEVQLKNIPDPVRPHMLHVSVPESVMPLIEEALNKALQLGGFTGVKISNISFRESFNQMVHEKDAQLKEQSVKH